MCLVANGAEQKAPENPETNSLDITHDEKRQEKHRIHQFFSSLLEAREYSTIEQRVEDAEQLVRAKRAELEDPANATDAPRLVSAQAALEAAQEALDALYARWAELEKKSG